MAQNLTKRLDRIERLIKEKLSTHEGPVYCLEGQEPEGVEPSGLIYIVRRYVEPKQREETHADLPPVEPTGDLFGVDTRKPVKGFDRRLEYDCSGII